jgi:hypothetical protein
MKEADILRHIRFPDPAVVPRQLNAGGMLEVVGNLGIAQSVRKDGMAGRLNPLLRPINSSCHIPHQDVSLITQTSTFVEIRSDVFNPVEQNVAATQFGLAQEIGEEVSNRRFHMPIPVR